MTDDRHPEPPRKPRKSRRKDARVPAPPRSAQPPGEPPRCSFCGRRQGEYRAIVKGPQANICNVCVSESVRLVADEPRD